MRITPTAEDNGLWDAMDQASDEVAKVFVANLSPSDEFSVFTPDGEKRVTKTANLKDILPYTPNDAQAAAALGVPRGRRDGLGTTHHETGPLRMGTDPATSVTNADGRFHGVDNAYVVGPALFPTIGSPNPMLTGVALLRRLGDHLAPPPVPYAPGGGFTAALQRVRHEQLADVDHYQPAGARLSRQVHRRRRDAWNRCPATTSGSSGARIPCRPTSS